MAAIRSLLGGATLALIPLVVAAQEAPAPAAHPRPPEKIYAATCGYCHGADVGPVIRGRGLQPAAVAFLVRRGKGAMPAFRPTEITDAELQALTEWLRDSKPDPKEHGR